MYISQREQETETHKQEERRGKCDSHQLFAQQVLLLFFSSAVLFLFSRISPSEQRHICSMAYVCIRRIWLRVSSCALRCTEEYSTASHVKKGEDSTQRRVNWARLRPNTAHSLTSLGEPSRSIRRFNVILATASVAILNACNTSLLLFFGHISFLLSPSCSVSSVIRLTHLALGRAVERNDTAEELADHEGKARLVVQVTARTNGIGFRRVRVDDAGKLRQASAALHRQRNLANGLACVLAHNGRTKDLVCALFAENTHETLSATLENGTVVAAEFLLVHVVAHIARVQVRGKSTNMRHLCGKRESNTRRQARKRHTSVQRLEGMKNAI